MFGDVHNKLAVILLFCDTYLELCTQIGKTPSRVASDLGLARSAVSMWKARGTAPNAETLQKIADYFGVTVDYLLTGEQKENPQPEAEGDIDSMVESVLSELADNNGDTLMLDGKPASPKAIEYLRESIRANIEHARRLNENDPGQK